MNLDLGNDDYFLCSWNGTEITQIHTKESLIEEYKETGLLEDKGWDISDPLAARIQLKILVSCRWDSRVSRDWQRGPETNVIELMDYLIEDKWLFKEYHNDNMTIMYIKTKQ